MLWTSADFAALALDATLAALYIAHSQQQGDIAVLLCCSGETKLRAWNAVNIPRGEDAQWWVYVGVMHPLHRLNVFKTLRRTREF